MLALLAPALALLLGAAQAEPDLELEELVRDAILDDSRVGSYAIVVTVEDGVATIRGVVGSEGAREAAGEAARRVEGVAGVVNGLIVRPAVELSDGEIELYVDQALSRDRLVDSHEIVVTVLDGEVALHGTVDSEREKERAAVVTRRVLGVKEVENELTVPPVASSQRPRDVTLEAAVATTLAEAGLEGVTVNVDRAIVILSGTVSSREERARAESLAFEAGATLVKNEIALRRSR